MPESGSAPLTDLYGGYTPDGIHRQKVRCKITVYSHVAQPDTPEGNGEYNLFPDVVQCEVSKSLKGGGGANFTLVPRRNYLNLIFPNDYVSIYFDPGDGRGWIRTFFGLIDRVSRSISVDQTGASSTRFQVVCSDLTKAFDKIQLYFNQQLINPNDEQAFRPDISNEFTQNLGGLAMRMSGITITGTPADILMSMCQVFLGFGAQFTLPDCLAKRADKTIQANRKARIEWSREHLPDVVKRALEAVGTKTIKQLQDVLLAESKQLAMQRNGGSPPTPEEENEAMVDVLRGFEMQGVDNKTPREILQALATHEPTRLAMTVDAKATLPTASLLDLLDFRHVEWRAIDGSILSASISQQEGTLWSVMNAWSHEFLNELFVDLRPMQDEPTPGGGATGYKQDIEVFEGGYSRDSDSLNGNIADIDPPGVRYEPCIVMREHPFSTVHDFQPPPGVIQGVPPNLLQMIVFGAIFSKDTGTTGRKVVSVPAVNPYLADRDPPATAIRSLDAITISVQDIVNENIGRSDNDVVNFIEVYTDTTGGGQVRSVQYLNRIVIPVTCGISVARHGLRVRKLISKFNRFSKNIGLPTSFYYVPTINATIRWAFMLDHWYQHNQEYLNGTMTLRGLPEIRVGYRLDVKERSESYYVENVSLRWGYTTNALMTTIQVTRGQRNDPFPVYVYPSSPGFSGDRKTNDSRLAKYFPTKNPSAVASSQYFTETERSRSLMPDAEDTNTADDPNNKNNNWAANRAGYETTGSSALLKAMVAELDEIALKNAPPSAEAVAAVQGAGVLGILKP
jgi:hypothetical protein